MTGNLSFQVSNTKGEDHEPHSSVNERLPLLFPDLILYRSILNDILLIVASLIVGSIVVRINFSLIDPLSSLFHYEMLSLISVILACGCVLTWLMIAFRRYNVRYLIANDGVKAIRGIISNNQIDVKLEYYQIRGTEIHRSLLQRLVGTGDLHIRGSTSNDTEVTFKGIYDPYRYQKLIQEHHRIEVQGYA